MKNYELENIFKSLQEVSSLETSVSVAVGLKIVQNKKKIATAYESVNDMKNAIIGKYAEDGEVKPDNPHYQDCVDDINELMNQECEELQFKKINVHDIEECELPLKAMEALLIMIEEG